MFIPLEQARLFSISFGSPSAPCLLGIGGWIGNWELWAPPFSILSAQRYTLAYDHRGSGATVAPIESISFPRLVDDVFAVLDAHDIERCVLAAESAVALTALGAALRQPDRISGLVIVDGLYYSAPKSEDDTFLTGLRMHYSQTLAGFVNACVPEPDCDHIKRWGRQILDRATPEAAIALYRMTGTIDLRADLPRITQPTLILHGSADALVSVAAAQWLARTLPNARFTVFDGAGHVPTLTRPQDVAREIMNDFKV